MQTYIKIGEQYLYAYIQIQEDKLWFRSDRGFKKSIVQQLTLTQISDIFILEALGGKQIGFTYEGQRYTIYEVGNGLGDYVTSSLENIA